MLTILKKLIIRKNYFYIPCLFEFVRVLSGDVKFSLCMILVSINGSFVSLAGMLCFRNFFLKLVDQTIWLQCYSILWDHLYSVIQFASYIPYFLEDFISMPLLEHLISSFDSSFCWKFILIIFHDFPFIYFIFFWRNFIVFVL